MRLRAAATSPRRRILFLGVLIEGGLLLLALLLQRLMGVPSRAQWRGWGLQGLPGGVVAALPMVGFFVLMLRWPVGHLRHLRDLCQRRLVPVFAASPWPDLLLFSILAGIGEELLFRGVIQGWLAQHLPLAAAITVSAGLFGAAHCVSRSYLIFATAFGIYLGVVAALTENLLTVIVAHSLYDFVALLYLLHGRWARRG